MPWATAGVVRRLSWEDRAKRYLKAELKRADIGYRELPNGSRSTA
jgi:hypothetical protein